jgi:PST family polysaccharide transporter
LSGRSALDKLLALRGGADLVALWAQLVSLMDVVSGVALAGIGTGLSVYVARTSRLERQREFLREALKLGLLLAAPLAIGVALAGLRYADVLAGAGASAELLAWGAAVGWIAVVPGLIASLWLGQQRRGLLLAFAVVGALLPLCAALFAPARALLPALLAAQALPALVALFLGRPADNAGRFRRRSHPLRRYLLPSLAIGILSPASALVARAAVGEALSWHDAGVLQALWRLLDWVAGFASGVLSVYFLPQLAAAREPHAFRAVLRAAAKATLIPGAAVLGAFLLVQRPLVALLYADDFQPSVLATSLIFAGGLVRIAAWVAMYGLYARRRTVALAVGELLSLPLFAALMVALGARLTLELAGACWLAAYCAYLAFNVWALRRA